jgi:hypothetical protein
MAINYPNLSLIDLSTGLTWSAYKKMMEHKESYTKYFLQGASLSVLNKFVNVNIPVQSQILKGYSMVAGIDLGLSFLMNKFVIGQSTETSLIEAVKYTVVAGATELGLQAIDPNLSGSIMDRNSYASFYGNTGIVSVTEQPRGPPIAGSERAKF